MKAEVLSLVNETCKLSVELSDYSCIKRINSIENQGKRIEMCVSSTLILDTIDSFKEYTLLLNTDPRKNKVALSLLTRYIYESYINFQYIFICKKDKTQARTKAFFHYGNYKKDKMQENQVSTESTLREWRKYVNPKSSSLQWHGKSFKEISEETNRTNIVYQALSQFTHPGIFTLERILDSNMFNGIIEDAIIFTSASVCDLMLHANISRLYGLKSGNKNQEKINILNDKHQKIIEKEYGRENNQ